MSRPSLVPFIRGDFTRRALLAGVLPLILASFFGTLWLAACHFPKHYDWTHRVISNLLSPRDNPVHYRLASIGVAFTGLLMGPAASYIYRRTRGAAPRVARLGAAAFATGSLLLTLAGLVVPQHIHTVFGVDRLHEILARSSAAGLALGMLCHCACAMLDYGRVSPLRHFASLPLLAGWCSVTLLPLGGLALAGCVIGAASLHTPFTDRTYAALHASVAWQLGFWEWIGAGAVFVFLLLSALLLPAETSKKLGTHGRSVFAEAYGTLQRQGQRKETCYTPQEDGAPRARKEQGDRSSEMTRGVS